MDHKAEAFIHQTGFPVYVVRFSGEDTVVLAGGGGGGNSGIRNKIVKYHVNMDEERMQEIAVYELERGDDAVMSLALHPTQGSIWACGSNRKPEDGKAVTEDNCRILKVDEEEVIPEKGKSVEKKHGNDASPGSVRELKSTTTLLPKSTTDYQKTAQFSPNGKWLVTGSDEGQLTLLSYPDLKVPFPEQGKEMKGGILDVDFDRKDERFVTVRENELTLWGMREGKLLESLDSPILHQKTQCTFRSARFGRGTTFGYLFAVINTKDRKASYVCKLSATTLGKVLIMHVHPKPITAFAISEKGDRLAYGTADLGVGILDTKTLEVLAYHKDVHQFPVTTVALNPSGSLVVSGSVDTTCVVRRLPEEFSKFTLKLDARFQWFFLFLFVFTYLYLQPDTLNFLLPRKDTHMEQVRSEL